MSFDLKELALFRRVAALGAIGRAGAELRLSPTNAGPPPSRPPDEETLTEA